MVRLLIPTILDGFVRVKFYMIVQFFYINNKSFDDL